MLNNELRFLGNDLPFVSYADSRVVIVPAPLEQTVTYGSGTSTAADAILKASAYVELYDEDLKAEPVNIGIFTHAGLSNKKLQIDFLKDLELLISRILEDDKIPVIIGGEHSISIAPIRAFKHNFSDKFGILQLDAHTDLRDVYKDSVYSHATVMRRAYDEGIPAIAIGIRSLCREEAEFISKHKYPIFYARDIYNHNAWIQDAVATLPENIYITFDIDALDPSVISNTGTPEPGGLSYYQVLELFQAINKSGKRVIGFDLVEFAPNGESASETFTCAKMIYKMIGLFFRKISGQTLG